MSTAIHLESLTKYYGPQRGVVDLDLEVKEGEVFGFLGPNGAGKTTTIRMLLDLIRPTGGKATLLGLDAQADAIEVRRRVGYVPGEPSLYERMTGHDLLRYLANLRGGVEWSNTERLAERLDCDLSRRIGTLSRGNRQKLAIIRAFMHKPELLVMDEPTAGLDPIMQEEFHRILEETKAAGGTVFLSSHILTDVEQVCDRVGIIRSGRLVDVEAIESLKSRAFRTIEIKFSDPLEESEFEGLAGVRDLSVTDGTLRCEVVGELDPLVKVAARHHVVNVVTHEPSLEEIFLAYYGEEAGNNA